MIASREGQGGLATILAATLSTQALATWSMLVLAAIAPMVALAFDLPAVLIGYQITIVYFVATVTSLFAGALVARLGACRTSQICLAGCALGCLIATLPLLAAIAFASVTIGFAYGLTNPSAAHLLAGRTTPRNRGLIFSIKQTGVPIGGMLAGLVTPWLALNLGWQAAVAFVAPLSLLLALSLQAKRGEWDGDRKPSTPIGLDALRGVAVVFAQPALRRLSICGFCFGAIQLCLMTFTVALAVSDLGYGAVLAGALLATAQGGAVVGRLAWGHVADRTQRGDLVLATIGLVTAACCLVLPLLDGAAEPWLHFGLMAIFGASAVGWNGVFVSEAVRLVPLPMAGTAAGATTFSTFAGVLVGPVIFVQLHGVLGSYAAAFAALSLPALLGAAAVSWTYRKNGQ